MAPRPPIARSLALLLLIPGIPGIAAAAVFLVPSDRQMIREADAIVLGTVTSVTPTFDGAGEIVTDVELRVSKIFKGPSATLFRLREPGGIIGNLGLKVSGIPEYYVGEEALIFARRAPGGYFTTYGMLLGKFSFVWTEEGERLLIRGAGEREIFGWDFLGRRHIEPLRRANDFIKYVAMNASGRSFDLDYLELPEQPESQPIAPGGEAEEERSGAGEIVRADSHVPPSAYTMGAFRWELFDDGGTASYRITGSQPGYDGQSAAQRALAAWTNDSGSNVRLALAGGAGGSFARDGVNSIIFNSSTDVPGGAIGYAQIYSTNRHTYKGETFNTVVEGDVVMRAGLAIAATVFDEALTHEVGHTIALRHSDEGEPSSNSAVMRSILTGHWGATLSPWDQDAVRHVYTGPTSAPTLNEPAGVVARAISTTQVRITWNGVSGAEQYRVERRSPGSSGYSVIATTSNTQYTDSTVTGNNSYLYRVRAVADSTVSSAGGPDLATTVIFADDPLRAGDPIRAVHLTQLRTAVNAVRELAGLAPASWTDPNPAGAPIKAVHWNQLRTRLNEARSALGLPQVNFPSPVQSGAEVRAEHVMALRNGVK